MTARDDTSAKTGATKPPNGGKPSRKETPMNNEKEDRFSGFTEEFPDLMHQVPPVDHNYPLKGQTPKMIPLPVSQSEFRR